MDEQQTFRWTDLNLFCLLRRLGRDVLLMVAAGLIAAMLTETAIQNLYKPEYTASATMAVSVKSGGYSSVLSNLNISSEIADTFTKLFESNMFGGIASSKLGTSSLPGKLTASVLPETNILTLRVTADTPEDDFRTLQLLLDNYDTVSEYVFQNVILKELDSPSVPVKPSNPVNRGQLLKRAFVGGAGAMMVLLLALLAVFLVLGRRQPGLLGKGGKRLFAVEYGLCWLAVLVPVALAVRAAFFVRRLQALTDTAWMLVYYASGAFLPLLLVLLASFTAYILLKKEEI